MKPIITIAILLSMLVGCTTEKKAATWFDNHPETDAQRCAVKYPATDSLHVTVDSAKYEQEVRDLLAYSDSVTNAAEARAKTIAGFGTYLDSLHSAISLTPGTLTLTMLDSLKSRWEQSSPPMNIPALTRSIEAKVRASIKPCHDSLIVRIDRAQHVADSLRNVRLAGDSTELVQLKHDKKQPGIVAGWLLTALLGKWWFWLLVVAAAAFLFRKPLLTALKL